MRGVDWPMISISQVATPVIRGTPSRAVADYWGGSIKWATAKDIATVTGRYIYHTEESITQKGLNRSAAKILPKGIVVITARGTVGALVQLGTDMAFNQTRYGLVPKNGVVQNYLYYSLRGSLGAIRSLTYGTVFETITIKTFDRLLFLLEKAALQWPDWLQPLDNWARFWSTAGALIIPGQAALFLLALCNCLGRKR